MFRSIRREIQSATDVITCFGSADSHTFCGSIGGHAELRATSHTRLRARDHCAASTLIGGKGGAGLILFHTSTLEGPIEYVSARGMESLVHGFLRGIEWNMFHGHLDYFEKPSLGSLGLLTQNRETMALRTLTKVDFFMFLSWCEDLLDWKFIGIAFG